MKKTTGEKSNKQKKSYLTNIQSFLQAYIETTVFSLNPLITSPGQGGWLL